MKSKVKLKYFLPNCLVVFISVFFTEWRKSGGTNSCTHIVVNMLFFSEVSDFELTAAPTTEITRAHQMFIICTTVFQSG